MRNIGRIVLRFSTAPGVRSAGRALVREGRAAVAVIAAGDVLSAAFTRLRCGGRSLGMVVVWAAYPIEWIEHGL